MYIEEWGKVIDPNFLNLSLDILESVLSIPKSNESVCHWRKDDVFEMSVSVPYTLQNHYFYFPTSFTEVCFV